jgi:hypothetical protein
MATLSIAALIQKVEPLSDKNWHKWKSQVMMVFRSDGNARLVQGSEVRPAADKAAEAWDKRDDAALAIIWACTSQDFLYLVEEETSGSACFAKLKQKFETTTFARRVELRKAFYNAEHDLSKPIEIYIQKVLDAKAQLTAMGHKIDDVEVKDVILMNLHPSYDGVKLSLITQPNEPDLATIRSILGSSSPVIDEPFIKSEPLETALATRFGKRGSAGRGKVGKAVRNHSGSSSESELKSRRGSHTQPRGIEDEKGYRWCNFDPTNDNCHRCGHKGHIAAFCMVEDAPRCQALDFRASSG